MLTIWCWAIRPLPSVNGMLNTVGRVPPASWAVKVGAVQLYSLDSTVIHGYLALNSVICRLSASTASWVAPGRRTPTEMVTGLWDGAGVAAGAWLPAAWVGAGVAVAVGVAAAELQALTETTARAAIASVLHLPRGLMVISSLTSLVCRLRLSV